MSKNRKQQKNKNQMELFDRFGRKPESATAGGIGKAQIPGVELLSRLERQRALTTKLLEEIVDYANLNKAYKQVVGNGGSAGVDQMDIEGFKEWYGGKVKDLRSMLIKEDYKVSPVLKVEIAKDEGGKRQLGIPTVKDRLIQQAIQQELSKHYEPYLSEHSYGFRAGRSAHQAVEQASRYIKEGQQWVVDIDLENFFDKINHDRLMQRLSKAIGDKRLLRLINAYLKSGMMEGGLVEQRISGTPQGSPLSPLLSNIVLDELDKELERRGHSFCRYADDCNIYVRSKKAGQRVMRTIIKFIEKKLKLKVNHSKSGVRHCSEVKFLGYTIMTKGKIRVSDKSIKRLKEKVREITRRNRGVNFESVIEELNRAIIGWTNYFRLANIWLNNFRDIDCWLRRKLRCYRLKQCGKKYTIVKLLQSLGCPLQKSWNVAMYSQGWWNMSKKVAVEHTMNNQWFAEMGLQSLLQRMSR
jgi:group II intron reverse transcriptase/maturase